MRQPLFLALSAIGIHPSDLLKLGVEIYSYNDHRSAPFPEPRLVGTTQVYLGVGSRHCHGINFTSDAGQQIYGASWPTQSGLTITAVTFNLRIYCSTDGNR